MYSVGADICRSMTMPSCRAASNIIRHSRAISQSETNCIEKGAMAPIFAMREKYAYRRANTAIACKIAYRLCRISPLCIIIIILPQQLRLKYAVIVIVKRLSVSSNRCEQKPQQRIGAGYAIGTKYGIVHLTVCVFALWISFQAHISRPCRGRQGLIKSN